MYNYAEHEATLESLLDHIHLSDADSKTQLHENTMCGAASTRVLDDEDMCITKLIPNHQPASSMLHSSIFSEISQPSVNPHKDVSSSSNYPNCVSAASNISKYLCMQCYNMSVISSAHT